jgi:type IV pilus assembly protein PilB
MKTPPSAELLDMEQAIRLLKTSRPTFYRWLRSGRIKGMKVGRQWRFYRQDIERFLKGEPPRIDLPASIGPLVGQLADKLRSAGLMPLPPHDESVAGAVTLLFHLALQCRASDIHVASLQTTEHPNGMGTVRLRVDGVLKPMAEFDVRLVPAVVEHLKTLAACDPRERAKPQDGRILLESGNDSLDMRLCFVPTVLGEAVTVRLLSRNAVQLTLDRIDYAPTDRERLLRALALPWGVVLCTGPTGSGKTTTLYACLNHVTRPEVKVMSIEDPVEYVLPGVVQMGVNAKAGLTFPAALRAVFRSDPDVVMVGEVRDNETLEVCLQTALTGHLVLSTLHTEDAPSAMVRMLNLGADDFLVANAVKLVVAQRLVRLLCPDCSVPREMPSDQLERARQVAVAGGLNWEALPAGYRDARGCPKCAGLGYRRRTVVSEVLEVTPEIGNAIRHKATADELRALAIRQGMTTMGADGVRRAALGQTTLSEALRVASA